MYQYNSPQLTDRPLLSEDIVNVQVLNYDLAENKSEEYKKVETTLKKGGDEQAGFKQEEDNQTAKENNRIDCMINQDIDIPDPTSLAQNFFRFPGEASEHQLNKINVADFDKLWMYLHESKAHHNSRNDLMPDDSICNSKMDFKIFMENFTDNAREYTYQNWNHFGNRGNVKAMAWETREKKPVTDMDFTEYEKEEKKYLDKQPLDKLTRSACLNYQYSPDYCFNSMIDVISIENVILERARKKKAKEIPTVKMNYVPRIFNDPPDSLYQPGEYPQRNQKPGNMFRTDTEHYFGRSMYFDDPKLNHKAIKRGILLTSQSLMEKSFFPLRGSKHLSSLMTQAFNRNTDYQRKRSTLKKRSEVLSSSMNSLVRLSEKFVEDFVEIDTKQERLNQPGLSKDDFKRESGSSDLEPEEWYQGIIDQEKPKDEISQLNWSGEQVQMASKYTKRKVKLIIRSLNHQDLIIWLRGFKGILRIARKRLLFFITHPTTEKILMACVIINTIILTLDGLLSKEAEDFLLPFNNYFTFIFLAAFLMRLTAHGPKTYLRSLFNIFDGVVVIMSVTELTINLVTGDGGSAISAFRALRIFRIFKVMRLTRILKSLKFMTVIITVIVETLEQYVYIAILLMLFLLIYALLGVQLYAESLVVKGVVPRANFDSIADSFLTLFQLLTFENWVDITTNLYTTKIPRVMTTVYVISWLIIGNFIFFNLFLALLLGGFESERVVKSLQENQDEFKELQEKIKTQQEEKKKELNELAKKRERERYDIKYIITPENKESFCEDDGMFEVLNEERQRARGTYFLNRPNINQDSSMEEIMYQIIEQKNTEDAKRRLKRRETERETKKRIFKDVHCTSSLYLFPMDSRVRIFAARIVSHRFFEPAIIFLITISSIKLVAETYIPRDNPTLSTAFNSFDNIITVLFIFEAVFKVLRNGLVQDKNSYFKVPWNVVDFVIVLASVIDMIFSGISIPTIKVIRALRPLRFVSHYKHMRIVVNSLVRIIGPLVNVVLVIMVVWVIFSILAMNVIGGKMNYCDTPDNYGVSKEQCIKQGKLWKRIYWNFDNIGESMVTLFVLSALESWPTVVGSGIDAGDTNTSGPVYNNYPYMWFYYISFIFISAFFLVDLFVGVIFYHYSEELEKEISTSCQKATPEQIRWIMMQKLVFKADSNFNLLECPKSKFRRFFFQIVTAPPYEIGMFFAILINIIVLALDYEGMSDAYSNSLGIISHFFSFLFLIEFIFKVIALKQQYFKDNWNLFDFFIVVISIADFIIVQAQGENSTGVTRLQFAKGLRAIRVIRLVKLFKSPSMAAFNKLINTLIFSLPTILNVLGLLFLTYCIFAVMGCFIFRDAVLPELMKTQYISFENFHMALLTLFRCSTGEDWPLVMYTLGDSNGNYAFARLYFMVFILVTTFIMLNLIDLVVVSIFENFYFDPDNALTHFEQITSNFNRTWNTFTMKHRGEKIHYLSLPRFFATLQEPMGFRVKENQVDEESVEDLIMSQRSFSIRKPYLGIVLLLSLYNTPVYTSLIQR